MGQKCVNKCERKGELNKMVEKETLNDCQWGGEKENSTNKEED